MLHNLSFITFAISCPYLDSKKNYKNVLGPLKFGGHKVHQWYNNMYENQIFCSFNIYTKDILSCAICCCVLGRLPEADTHSVEVGILSDVLLQ
jgi:hypothetical protein